MGWHSWAGLVLGVLGVAVGIYCAILAKRIYRRQKRDSEELAKSTTQDLVTTLTQAGVPVTPQLYAGVVNTVGRNLGVHLAGVVRGASSVSGKLAVTPRFGDGSPGGQETRGGDGPSGGNTR